MGISHVYPSLQIVPREMQKLLDIPEVTQESGLKQFQDRKTILAAGVGKPLNSNHVISKKDTPSGILKATMLSTPIILASTEHDTSYIKT